MNSAAVQVSALCVLMLASGLLWLRGRRRRATTRSDGGYPASDRSGYSIGELRKQIVRWTTTTNHRDIGILYLTFGTFAGLWGGVDAMMMRTELLTPRPDVWTPDTYNALFTMHGLTLLIFFVTPVFFGVANYFLPLLVGADDMAFPRLNAIGFWILPPALLLARAGLFIQVIGQVLGFFVPPDVIQFFLAIHEPGIGWTLYTPLSVTTSDPDIDFVLLGLHLSGIATTIGAINFLATGFFERDEDVTWANLDLFSWNMLTTSALILFAFPLLGSAIIMLLLDRNFGTTFFSSPGGGPLLWQHLFWFWGHPEVYIIFLPATGLMSTILPKFARRQLFGYRFIVYSTLGIGIMSFGVWAHHMFVTGIDPRIRASFMAVSIAIAVPSAIKVFNWLTTMWDGEIDLTAPMILCVGGIGTFIVGGVTGVFLAAIPIDVLYHGTYYVVGHFHLILMGIIPMMMIAASYYWYPILTRRMYDQRLAKFQSVLLVFGSIVTFGTILLIGMMGMPRRLAAYPVEFTPFQQIASVGGFAIGLSILLWLYNMLWSYWTGDPIEDADPWDLKVTGQFTREWQWFEERLEREYGITTPAPATTRPSFTTEPGAGSPGFARTVRPVAAGVGENVVAGAISGLVGTLLMSGVLFAGVVVGVFSLRSFGDLSGLIGLPGNVLVGYLLFLAGGMTTWALLFLALSEYLPGRLLFVSGLVYATIIASGFAIAFYSGEQGLALVGYVAFVLVAHWLYGLGLTITLRLLTSQRRIRRLIS